VITWPPTVQYRLVDLANELNNSPMFAFVKRRHFGFGLLLGLSFLLVVSYLALAGIRRKNNSSRADPIKTSRTAHTKSASQPVSLAVDADNDGIPDTAELQTYMDRENFRRWFTLVAEAQFYRLSEDWNSSQRDCSGLVRFAWREALRKHDRPWFQKMGPGYSAIAADVSRYNLESGPLGEKLFRTNFGSYKDGDLSNGTFSEFADARSLKSFNTKLIGRDRQDAQPGDLLFFYQPWVEKFPYHVMLFLGDSKLSDERTRDWVVYHTGSSPTDDGTIKKVQLSVLDQHPNPRWRPVESNPNFLGFYRLKILD
jgi:uncharacterized protein YfaT (DUF1175 family)